VSVLALGARDPALQFLLLEARPNLADMVHPPPTCVSLASLRASLERQDGWKP
jgi:hypothetical protein